MNRYGQHGYSLIELMIALAISTFIMLSSAVALSALSNSTMQSLRVTKLNQQINQTMNLMTRDIRRAGYWDDAENDLQSGGNTNPYMAASEDITVGNEGSCFLLSYDLNKDGDLPDENDSSGDERFGFRLDDDVIQFRTSDQDFDCTADSDDWSVITDSDIMNVTDLTFTVSSNAIDIDGSGPDTSTVSVRNVTISITAESAQDSSITRTLTRTVRLKNDKYTP